MAPDYDLTMGLVPSALDRYVADTMSTWRPPDWYRDWRPGTPLVHVYGALTDPRHRIFYDAIAKVTYKPGWRIELTEFCSMGDGRTFEGQLHVVTPDSWHPERMAEVLMYEGIAAPYLHENIGTFAVSWLERLIRRCEDHEYNEWLRVDGVPIRNPHA